MKFINRNKELADLEKRWNDKNAEFFIIYGKRRVGKTELIKQFIKGKSAVYFLADKRTTKEQLQELGALFGNYFKDTLLKQNGFASWLDVFVFLKERVKEPFVFAVDEYPYLTEVDKSITSVFQKGWDEYLKDSKVYLILSGSSVAMMESETLNYKSPLYGRRTGQLLIKPMDFNDSWKFFPKSKFDDFMQFYTVLGGTPAYLQRFDEKESLKDNIISKIFSRTEYLHNEIEFILKEELREPKNYLSILKAISFGKHKFGEIVNDTGLEKNIMNKYLQTLNQLQLIEKEVPVTEKKPEKSRKGLYKITDNFFRFWFQYVFPFKSELEIERYKEVLKSFDNSFFYLESLVYENVCKDLMWNLQDELFEFNRVGRWWNNNEEIDIVAFNSETKDIIFGECKWSKKPIGINIYESLKKKAAQVEWNEKERKDHFILFSKSGFTPDLEKLAKKEGIYLVHEHKMTRF